MNAVELVQMIESSGGHFLVDGEKVVITPSAAALPVRDRLIEHKQEIFILVRAREPKPAPAVDPPSTKQSASANGQRPMTRVDRKRAIIHEYDGGSTLQQVGDKYHLSRERIRQIVYDAQPMRDRQRAQRDLYASYIQDFLEIMGDRGQKPDRAAAKAGEDGSAH